MALSKPIELARARRLLKRIEEDRPGFELRIAGLSPDGRAELLRWFDSIVLRHKDYVQELERDLE